MRRYRGPLRGIVHDWAGTVVDYGCMAPLEAIVEVFRAQGIAVTVAEARKPMGAAKREHVHQLLGDPSVEARWRLIHHRPPNDADVQGLYELLTPMLISRVAQHTALIPGTQEAMTQIRRHGWKIGSCTGYTREMMVPLLAAARQQGYEPDAVVCPEETGSGRPAPWMCYLNATRLDVYPMEALVKIGDTPADIAEGINAGMWTIAVAKSGNELGMPESEVESFTPEEVGRRLADVYTRFYAAGAHYVVDSIADVVSPLEEIDARTRRGEHPKDDDDAHGSTTDRSGGAR